jgi:hypothetical protein
MKTGHGGVGVGVGRVVAYRVPFSGMILFAVSENDLKRQLTKQ